MRQDITSLRSRVISEALGVAVSMNAGAALIFSGRVLDAVDAKSAAAHSA
jgi:hypothetical protein